MIIESRKGMIGTATGELIIEVWGQCSGHVHDKDQ